MSKLKFSNLLYTKAAAAIEFGIVGTMGTDREIVSPLLKKEIEILKGAKLFLIDDNFFDHKQTVIEDIAIDALELSPPFKTCFFELNDAELSLATVGTVDNTERVGLHGLLVNETSPGEFSGWVFGTEDNNTKPVVLRFKLGKTLSSEEQRNRINQLVGSVFEKLCRYIHDCTLGEEKVFRTVDFRTNTQGKNLFKLNHIIRCKPTECKNYPEPAFTREIDWNMRWWVRGHWRRLPDARLKGKSRTGDYDVNGFTWVTEHLRGPEAKPIRKATYVLGVSCQL